MNAFRKILFSIVLATSQLAISQMATAQSETFNSNESLCKQVVLREVSRIEEFFATNQNVKDEEKIDLMNKQNLRSSFFKLELIARIMDSEGGQFLEDQRTRFKNLEGLIGKVELSRSLEKISTQLQESRLIDYFRVQKEANIKILIDTFTAEGFWNNAAQTTAVLKKGLTDGVTWKDGKTEKKYLIKHASDYIEFLHKKVEHNDFNNPDIEKGLHELRRRLRWIIMESMAVNGAIQFVPEPNLSPAIDDLFQKLKADNPDILKDKYLAAKPSEVPKPIRIPQFKTAILSQLVVNIGDLKDVSEMQIYTTEALTALKVSPAEMAAITAKLNELLKSTKLDHQALAQKIQSQLASTKVLQEFAKDLKEMN